MRGAPPDLALAIAQLAAACEASTAANAAVKAAAAVVADFARGRSAPLSEPMPRGNDELLRIKDVARILKISEKSARRHVYKHGRKEFGLWYLHRDQIAALALRASKARVGATAETAPSVRSRTAALSSDAEGDA